MKKLTILKFLSLGAIMGLFIGLSNTASAIDSDISLSSPFQRVSATDTICAACGPTVFDVVTFGNFGIDFITVVAKPIQVAPSTVTKTPTFLGEVSTADGIAKRYIVGLLVDMCSDFPTAWYKVQFRAVSGGQVTLNSRFLDCTFSVP